MLSQLNSSASVAILRAAEPPPSPYSPSWIRNMSLAVVAGLILGVGVALILETLDDTILTKDNLEHATDGVPVLGLIPAPHKTRFGTKSEAKLITSRTGAFTEAFRTLRSAIELGQASDSELRSILVTSANSSEGKSTVAAHLAVAFARSGSSVVVISMRTSTTPPSTRSSPSPIRTASPTNSPGSGTLKLLLSKPRTKA